MCRIKGSYRSRVDAAVLGAGHDEAVTNDVQPIGESLILGTVVAPDNGGDDLHLSGGDLADIPLACMEFEGWEGSYVETGGSCPDAVASGADDGGLVDVAGANEAGFC